LNSGWSGQVIFILALSWTTVLLISGRAWFSNTQLLAREMNMSMVPIFSHMFNRQFLYTNNQDNEATVLMLLEDSSLITTNGITIHSDDSYYAYGEVPIEFHELSVVAKEGETANNAQRSEIELFKGLLVVATLPRSHSAETYISTDGDRTGFAHRGFWSDLLETGTVKETILESNDFEETLHVATSDPVAAREILTPNLMAGVYDWWNEHKLNMRIAFKSNKLYLLMPESTIHIATTTTSSKAAVIKRYAVSLVRPMWRSLILVDDVTQ
jgi:hypothetical protein